MHYGAIFGRIRFIFSFSSLIDLVSTVPSFIALILIAERVVTTGFISATHYEHTYALAAWRLVRLLRLFRLQESVRTLRTIGLVFYRRSADLMTAFFVIFFLLLLMSVVMYYIEKDAQPDKFQSILRSFYFTVVTIFTVGYGDVTPITGLGKFFVCVFIAVAFIFMSIPVSIFNAAFLDQMQEERVHALKQIQAKKERAKEKQRRDKEKLEARKKDVRDLIVKRRNNLKKGNSPNAPNVVLDEPPPPVEKTVNLHNKSGWMNNLFGEKEVRRRTPRTEEEQNHNLEAPNHLQTHPAMNSHAHQLLHVQSLAVISKEEHHKLEESHSLPSGEMETRKRSASTAGPSFKPHHERVPTHERVRSHDHTHLHHAESMVTLSDHAQEKTEFEEFFTANAKRKKLLANVHDTGNTMHCPHCRKPLNISFSLQASKKGV